jgi:hypothetical protein
MAFPDAAFKILTPLPANPPKKIEQQSAVPVFRRNAQVLAKNSDMYTRTLFGIGQMPQGTTSAY